MPQPRVCDGRRAFFGHLKNCDTPAEDCFEDIAELREDHWAFFEENEIVTPLLLQNQGCRKSESPQKRPFMSRLVGISLIIGPRRGAANVNSSQNAQSAGSCTVKDYRRHSKPIRPVFEPKKAAHHEFKIHSATAFFNLPDSLCNFLKKETGNRPLSPGNPPAEPAPARFILRRGPSSPGRRSAPW